MADVDLEYLCKTIGNLAGVPVRLFEDGRQVFYYSLPYLPVDPMGFYGNEILAITSHVGYFMTPLFHYYGIVNSGSEKIVIGPSRQIEDTSSELRELAFTLGVEKDDTDDFVAGMKSIVRMPFESILQILCTINHVLNGEKLSLEDISIHSEDQEKIERERGKAEVRKKLAEDGEKGSDVYNTYDLEETLMRFIRKGDTASLREWMKSAPAVRGGVLASGILRQQRNMFIVSVTLSSRAAIHGGMDRSDAFALSDSYIQQCELLSSPVEIMNLQYRMILDYTERVERLHLGSEPSKLLSDVSNYIQHHISEVIRVDDIAATVFMSRGYLSRRFHAETGETLSSFILRQKTEEAKRLLRYTEKPLTAIGSYLSFSSPSHFSRVFRSYTGMTPREYREKHT